MPEIKRSLSDEECLQKALECLQMARRMHDPTHRTMLEHMAHTWERIAEDIMRAARRRRADLTMLI